MARSPKPVEPGTAFGTRVVIRELPGRPALGRRVRRVMLCRCSGCGAEMEVLLQNLPKGGCPTCSASARKGRAPPNKRHGMTRTTTHRIWKAMRQRCENPNDSGYVRYGGRGIRVCERWGSFELFLADMGERPSVGHSVDRIDNDGDYEPGNCRWATDTEQAHNKRNNVRLVVNGLAKTIAEWAGESPVTTGAIAYRLRKGWSPEDAVALPPGARGDGKLQPGHQVSAERWARSRHARPASA